MGVLIAFGGLFQVKEVHDQLLVLTHDHPHWVGLLATATAIATLLHNPSVQHCLGMDGSGEE